MTLTRLHKWIVVCFAYLLASLGDRIYSSEDPSLTVRYLSYHFVVILPAAYLMVGLGTLMMVHGLNEDIVMLISLIGVLVLGFGVTTLTDGVFDREREEITATAARIRDASVNGKWRARAIVFSIFVASLVSIAGLMLIPMRLLA